MDVLDAIRARKSIRGYKPDPVPKEVLSQILDVARHAPSAMNTQPWEITVITGDVLASIRMRTLRGLLLVRRQTRMSHPYLMGAALNKLLRLSFALVKNQTYYRSPQLVQVTG